MLYLSTKEDSVAVEVAHLETGVPQSEGGVIGKNDFAECGVGLHPPCILPQGTGEPWKSAHFSKADEWHTLMRRGMPPLFQRGTLCRLTS